MALIEAVIDCLSSVNDFKVQEKWGHTLLRKYLAADACSKLKMTEPLEKRRVAALEVLTTKMEQIGEHCSAVLKGRNF